MQAGSELPAATGPAVRRDPALAHRGVSTRWRSWLLRESEATRAQGVEGPLVYTRTLTGRRPAYLRVFERLFAARRADVRDLLLRRAPVLFLVVEEAFVLYLVVGLLRAITGRRTVGLLSRPASLVASGRGACRWRRMILGLLKRCRSIQTLSLLPFGVDPSVAGVADGWIYDPQLWDLTDAERIAIETLRSQRRPGARFVLTAIGTQSLSKGFDLFAYSYRHHASLRARFRFIACGAVAPASAGHIEGFCTAGGVAVDRRISDAELLGAYAASDAVWCLYPPAGDHATGILGRAVQLGLPVVVHEGSPAHRLCVLEGLSHVAATPEHAADRLAGPLPPRDATAGRRAAQRFARQSEAALRVAFGHAEARVDAVQTTRLPSSPITF